MFSNSCCFFFFHKSAHFVSPNIQHSLDTFSNLSLIYLKAETCQTSFFWYCFDVFMFDKIIMWPFEMCFGYYVKWKKNYLTSILSTSPKITLGTESKNLSLMCYIVQLFQTITWPCVYWKHMHKSNIDILPKDQEKKWSNDIIWPLKISQDLN